MFKWLRKSFHFRNSSDQNSDIRIRSDFKSFPDISPAICDKCGFEILESTHQRIKIYGGDGNHYDKWFYFTPNLCNCEITKRDGKIHLNIFITTNKLIVEVNRGRNLFPSNSDDIYGAFLKIELLPTHDNRKKTTKKTKTVDSSTNPVWNETFKIKLKPEDIDRQLQIEVWVSENDCIGSFSFDVLTLSKSPTRGWFKVQPQEEEEEDVDHDILEPEKNIPSSKSRETMIIQPPKSILKRTNDVSPTVSKKKVRLPSYLNFQVLKILGKGSFGKVVLSRKRGTRYLYAIKVIEKDDFDKHMEKKILKLLEKSPFLVQLHSCSQSAHRWYFVMEYVSGGNLLFQLKQCGKFGEPTVRFYAAEIAIGLFFLHSRGVIYRDFKLENVMLCRSGHIKITSFGSYKKNVFENDTINSHNGTADYMAPEIVLLQPYGKSVDWWSYGIVIYEMLTGVVPFHGETISDVFYPDELSNQAVSICQELLIKNPSKRLGSGPQGEEDIRGHRFFQEIDWKKIENRQVEPPFIIKEL